MKRDSSFTTGRDEAVPAPPAVLVEFGRKWESALRACRNRKILFYTLLSVLLGVVVIVVLFSLFVYLGHRSVADPPPTPAELAETARSILARGFLLIGWIGVALTSIGFISALQIALAHERPLREARRKAQENRWHDALVRCGGKLNVAQGRSQWETFERHNRRYLIGYLVATAVALALATAGLLMR
jgi:hypothetical protein